MRTLSWEATAPRSILLGISWAHGSPGMLFGSSQVRAHRLERLGRAALISCRCAAANSFNYPSVEDERPVSPQQCTYGALNVLWVASELKRLLTMQVRLQKQNVVFDVSIRIPYKILQQSSTLVMDCIADFGRRNRSNR